MCDEVFDSTVELAGHKLRSHASGLLVRKFFSGYQCPCCLLTFSRRLKLLRHADRSKVCKLNFITVGIALTPTEEAAANLEQFQESDLARKKLRWPGHGEDRPLQALGPTFPILIPAGHRLPSTSLHIKCPEPLRHIHEINTSAIEPAVLGGLVPLIQHLLPPTLCEPRGNPTLAPFDVARPTMGLRFAASQADVVEFSDGSE